MGNTLNNQAEEPIEEEPIEEELIVEYTGESVEETTEDSLEESRETELSEDLLLGMRGLINNVHQFGSMPAAELTTLILLRRMTEAKGYARPTELKKRLMLSTPAISRMLHTLEGKGYLIRNINAKDHRFVMVEITQKGEERLRKEVALFRELFMNTARKMGIEKMVTLLSGINEFAAILREEIEKA